MQFLAGVGSGTFIPLSMGFIARSLPARLIIYGIAITAMNLESSRRTCRRRWKVGTLTICRGDGSIGSIAECCQ
jgi:hypothetical protein